MTYIISQQLNIFNRNSELESEKEKFKLTFDKEKNNWTAQLKQTQDNFNRVNSDYTALVKDHKETLRELESHETIPVSQAEFRRIYLTNQVDILTNSNQAIAEEKEQSECRYFDARCELETTRTDLGQEVNKNKINQQVIKDLKAQIANLTLNKASETASLECFSPSKTLLSELSSLEDQQKEITFLEKTVKGLNKQVSGQTARADDLEKQLVRYQQEVPLDGEDSDYPTQNLQPIVKGLSRMFTKEDKLAIPTFSGKDNDGLVTAWLRKAEH